MPTLVSTSFKSPRDNWSTHKVQFYVYTGPSTYVAGGDSFLPSDVGLGTIEAIIPCCVANNGTATRLIIYDTVAQKLEWYVPNTGAEASGDLSGYSVTLLVIGS
jgi:hypothetical protein